MYACWRILGNRQKRLPCLMSTPGQELSSTVRPSWRFEVRFLRCIARYYSDLLQRVYFQNFDRMTRGMLGAHSLNTTQIVMIITEVTSPARESISVGHFTSLRTYDTQLYLMVDALTDENRSEALTILQDFSTQITRANTPRRFALTIAIGEWRTALSNRKHLNEPFRRQLQRACQTVSIIRSKERHPLPLRRYQRAIQ